MKGGRRTPSVSSRIGSKLPLPLYADVRLYIPMTHRNDPKLRTVNINAECGGTDDWYYYSPWRAPGAAPVIDACGVAGGHRPPDGPFGGVYVNTYANKIGAPSLVEGSLLSFSLSRVEGVEAVVLN